MQIHSKMKMRTRTCPEMISFNKGLKVSSTRTVQPALSCVMAERLFSPAACSPSPYDSVYLVFMYTVEISNMLTSLDKCKKAVTSSLSLESRFIL